MMFASMRRWCAGRVRCAISAPSAPAAPDFAVLLRLVQLGLPIALALFFEVTLCLPSSRCWSPARDH